MNEPADPALFGLNRLHPVIGTEVRGFSIADPDGIGSIEKIRRAWLEHPVLVFHDQAISDAEQIRFARHFGELEIHPSVAHRASDHPEIYRVSNVDEAGNILPEHSNEWLYLNLSWLWHTDSSFRKTPSKGSILHGIEVLEQGGETLFANMQAAYEHLDEQTKAAVEGLAVVHSHDYIISLSSELSQREERGEYTDLPPVTHPLVRVHPETGKRSLFLSPHTMVGIEQMPESEGRALLDRLIEHATGDRFVYRHRWRAHDVIMWDNRCTMHMVTPFDNRVQRRIMHRTTIVGDEAPIAASGFS
jgi:taurine dioxygenase